jgi:hypothetical protein
VTVVSLTKTDFLECVKVKNMALEPTQLPNPTLDLNGLSPDAVRIVQSLVRLLQMNGQHTIPSQNDPEKWSTEWYAWIASQPKRPITLADDRESIYTGCGE